MPQLDTLSFFTQIFWFVLIIVFFYFIMVTKIIPTISNIFKIRSQFKFVKNVELNVAQTSSLDKVINENLSNIKNTLNNNQSVVKNWTNSVISNQKETNFNSGFNSYLTNVGELISKNKF
jgi:predicted PurR-regulated permease PerM